jgi:GNAT superfamily N-acetyltransferase
MNLAAVRVKHVLSPLEIVVIEAHRSTDAKLTPGLRPAGAPLHSMTFEESSRETPEADEVPVDAGELMRLHVRALFAQDGDGRLLTVNETGGAPAPRFFLGRTPSQKLWWIRHDVDASLVDELRRSARQSPAMTLWQSIPLVRANSLRHSPAGVRSSVCGQGLTSTAPPDLAQMAAAVRITPANVELLTPYLRDWHVDVDAGVPMAASLHDGMAVSVCCSARVTDRAHEAGVYTHPEFHGRGHASRAVAEWAAAVWQSKCVPLYSTSWENRPSQALARRLGLVQFGVDLHIT